MDIDKALIMFKELESEFYALLEEESCNVMVEKAMMLGYDYANGRKEE